MHVFKLDYTNTFIDIESNKLEKYDFMKDWNFKLIERRKLNINKKQIKNINPKIIPRNHIVEKILNETEEGIYKNLDKFLLHLSKPYSKDIPHDYTKKPLQEEKVYQTFCGT